MGRKGRILCIMEGVLSRPYAGKIYPVNQHAIEIYGRLAFHGLRDITGRVDMAIMAIMPCRYLVNLC